MTSSGYFMSISVSCQHFRLRGFVGLTEIGKLCLCSLSEPVLNCSFDDNVCEYNVSSTSASFAFSKVFSISNLGNCNTPIIYLKKHEKQVCIERRGVGVKTIDTEALAAILAHSRVLAEYNCVPNMLTLSLYGDKFHRRNVYL